MLSAVLVLYASARVAALSTSAAPRRASVAVVTWERPEYLARCVAQIAAQEWPRDLLDVVIVDDSKASCRAAVERALGGPLEETLRGAALEYVWLPERATIGAKRNLAMERLAVLAGDRLAVAVSWDDDDVFGVDRLTRQIEPIARGGVDATLATPERWRWEAAPCDAAPLEMTLGLSAIVPRAFAIADPRCELGLELVDEAIASLAYRLELHGVATYPDVSYDEDRAFVRDLKSAGARLRRLEPGAPSYVHVKHAAAAADGPLTRLYASGAGAAASPPLAAALGIVATLGATDILRSVLKH